jgi:hypothetical protein
MLPELPYPVLVPVVSVVALGAAKVLADEDAHPARHALASARKHAAHAVVTVALIVVCASAPVAGRGVA